MTYQEAKDYIDKVPKSGIFLGLDAIANLLNELGNPQDSLKFVHLAGTNGKGSVLSYLASILKAANYKTGQYTSPALISKREQIQVNGEWIEKESYANLACKIKKAMTSLKEKNKALPTVFEVETAMAFLYFQQEKCELVILETGMGGRDDATNIVKNTLVAGFTSISLDHMSFLGETIEEIATIKSGIIKSGAKVVSGIQKPGILSIIQQKASEMNNTLWAVSKYDIKVLEESYNKQVFTYKDSEPLSLKMPGRHQVENAALALEIIEELQSLDFNISDDNIKEGLNETEFFGRLTCLRENPLFIVDGAHNENGVTRLKENILSLFPNQKITFIMGIYKDKEYHKIAKQILPLAKKVYTVTLPNKKRSISATELKNICEKNLGDNKCQIIACTSVDEAVKFSLESSEYKGVIIAFGSLSYLSCVAESLQ